MQPNRATSLTRSLLLIVNSSSHTRTLSYLSYQRGPSYEKLSCLLSKASLKPNLTFFRQLGHIKPSLSPIGFLHNPESTNHQHRNLKQIQPRRNLYSHLNHKGARLLVENAATKGMAFTEEERIELKILGLLPPAHRTQELQVQAALNFVKISEIV